MADPASFKLTPTRAAWLRRVAVEGTAARRDRGPIGYDCMQAGLTRWSWADRETGQRLSLDEVHARAFSGVKIIGETLTEAGRRALEQAENEIAPSRPPCS